MPDDFDLYLSQSSFLRPIKANRQVVYHVDHTADGRSYCTRVVRAAQRGAAGPCLFMSILSFQRRKRPRSPAEGGANHSNDQDPEFADPVPDMGGLLPHYLPPQGFEQMNFQFGDGERLKRMGVKAQDPFDWRLLPFELKAGTGDPSQTRIRGYVRANTETPLELPDAVNMASFALLSYQSLFELTLYANWEAVPEVWRHLAITVSLNSRISFHVPTARLDEWMVCESGISWGANGRITADQRFWNRDTGELLMTCTQDAFVSRPKPKL